MKLLRPRDAAAAIGVSVSSIWRLRKNDGSFPRPFRVGVQAVAWDEDELRAWVQSRRMTTRNAAAIVPR